MFLEKENSLWESPSHFHTTNVKGCEVTCPRSQVCHVTIYAEAFLSSFQSSIPSNSMFDVTLERISWGRTETDDINFDVILYLYDNWLQQK
jgi:hypothetical protein